MYLVYYITKVEWWISDFPKKSLIVYPTGIQTHLAKDRLEFHLISGKLSLLAIVLEPRLVNKTRIFTINSAHIWHKIYLFSYDVPSHHPIYLIIIHVKFLLLNGVKELRQTYLAILRDIEVVK